MKPIQAPPSNIRHPDNVLAQSVAADSGWYEGAGAIYDGEHGAQVAASMDDLGKIMRHLGWFTAAGAWNTGINWHAVPHQVADRSAPVQQGRATLGL